MIRLLTSWEIITHINVSVMGDFLRFCSILVERLRFG